MTERRPGRNPRRPAARTRAAVRAILAVVALTILTLVPQVLPSARAADELLLRVGSIDEMKTRNPLAPIARDADTKDVLDRVYDRPIKEWTEGLLRAFLAKGIDADEDGTFEAGEYGVWSEASPVQTPLVVTVYYDFNGARWHDGAQMTVWDLYFSYHLAAMDTWFNTDVQVLFCAVGRFYESCDRQLGIRPAAKSWDAEGAMPGDPALRAAVEFRLVEPFARFSDRTLAPLLFPAHVWSRTGGGRHEEFGCAVWIPPAEAAAKGIPECGTADAARWGQGIPSTEPVPGSTPYRHSSAAGWNPSDADVIGSGPFRFRSWTYGAGVFLNRFEDYYVGGSYDARVASYLHVPRITGIEFLRMRTMADLIYALKGGQIDVIRGNVGPFWYPEIMPDPNIAVESNPDPGFFYMAYNLRREPWGYANGDPAQGDRGYWLRQAVSHLADKRTIVQNLLQNFGVVGHGVVSPANAFWYNDNIPKPGYDVAAARAILDDLATDDPSDPGDPYDPGFSLDPGSTSDCTMDNPAGCRSLPRLGTQAFEISMPGADYDPVRASAGAMLAAAMRQVGLNARTGPPPYYSFCVRDFDLYILGWRIQGTDPDYLFSFFHSSNWPCGQNYPGIEDATLDLVIEASRREMDRDVRRQDIFEAQRILADLRPYEVLYHQTNIEAYRQDRFVNWTVSSGTIWNEQSLFGIRPPGVKIMHLAVTAPFAIPAGAGESLRFIVRDERLAPVEAAEVSVQIASADGGDPGALTSGAQSGTSLILQTDEGGNALARYDAPPVVGESRRVILNAIASHPDFDTTPAQDTVITVVGPGLRFLRILLGLPAGDLGYPNSELPVRLDVRDQDGTPQPDTPIAVRLEPAGESSFLSGTAEEGRSFVVTFPAAGVYTISADATGPGPIPQWTFVTVWVIEPTNGTKPPPDLRDEPPSLAVLFVGGTAVIVAAVVIWGWRRARRPR